MNPSTKLMVDGGGVSTQQCTHKCDAARGAGRRHIPVVHEHVLAIGKWVAVGFHDHGANADCPDMGKDERRAVGAGV